MLEQLFEVRRTLTVDGKVYGYTLGYRHTDRYTATVKEITPVGDFLFGVYSVPTFGHKEAVKVAIMDQILATEEV